MTSIQATVREYRASCDKIRGRIGELNEEILRRRKSEDGSETHGLESRRYQLYTELAHMEQSIAEMQEYLRETTRGRKAARPGRSA